MTATLFLVLVAVWGSTAATTQPCSCSTAALPRLPADETARKVVYKTWPSPPPGARIEGSALFEVVVSADGKVCCLTALSGHPLLLNSLVPAIRQWRFTPGKSFVGLIGTRYSSAGYEIVEKDAAVPKAVTDAAVCALTAEPGLYSGKTAAVTAYAISDYHGTFLRDPKCKKLILLVLPEGAASPPIVTLKRDDVYRRFDAALHDYEPGRSQSRKRVEARFTGRFEYQNESEGARSPLGAQWQLVLESVSMLRLR